MKLPEVGSKLVSRDWHSVPNYWATATLMKAVARLCHKTLGHSKQNNEST